MGFLFWLLPLFEHDLIRIKLACSCNGLCIGEHKKLSSAYLSLSIDSGFSSLGSDGSTFYRRQNMINQLHGKTLENVVKLFLPFNA